ncbi:MAG: recombination regulator RecX [Clostridiales bacterium]|nr:recombination regulator RecX [Clostridiales bacterium]
MENTFIVSAMRQTSPGRVTVTLCGGEEIKTTLNVVTDLRLYSGRELDGEELRELRAASAAALARNRAMELLSRRPMSEKELIDKLIRKGEDEETAADCARWLRENGFLDDESYAAAVARHYAAKGYGPGRVRAELSRRGVDRELWDDTIEAMPENSEKMDRFIAARLTDPEDREQVRKVSAALYRRGYSWEEIRSALGRFNAETEE